MGQAFDEAGNVLGEAVGNTKREVFDQLIKEFPQAHEMRIKSLKDRLDAAEGRLGGPAPSLTPERATFSGWAIVDVLGHQRYVGYVMTEYFGSSTFFRVETPGRHQREIVLAKEEYIAQGYGFGKPGMTVVRAAAPGAIRLIGAGSIYMLTPASQEEILGWLDENAPADVLEVRNADGTKVEINQDVPWW